MSVRQDTAQLIITIDTQESRDYQKTLDTTKQLVKDLKNAEVGSEDYNTALRKIITSSQALSNVDVLKLTGKQLRDRQRQLKSFQQTLLGAQFAESGLEAELKDVNKALYDQGQRVRQTEAKMGGFGKSISKIGPLIIATFAVHRVVDFFKTLFTNTNQLSTVENRFRTVFGAAGVVVEEFGKKNSIAMGLTVGEFKNAAASAGDLLKPLGFTEEAAASLSLELLSTGASLNEFTGGQRSTEEVAKILNKALLGEREQLKELGVSILEADVKARLLSKGQDKLTGSALKQAKAIASLELITENSTDALKSYEEGTNATARAQASLSARARQLVEDMGQKLKPVFDFVLTVSERLFSSFTDGADTTTKLGKSVAIVKGFFEGLGYVFSTIYNGAKEFFSLLGSIPGVGTAFANQFDRMALAAANVSATIAGLKAATRQATINMITDIGLLVARFDLLALKAKKAVNFFDSDQEKSLERQINQQLNIISAIEETADQIGGSVGSAYSVAFINEIKENTKAVLAENKKLESALISPADIKINTDADSGGASRRVQGVDKIDTLDPTSVVLDPKKLETLAAERIASLDALYDGELTRQEIAAIKALTTEEEYDQLRLAAEIAYNERKLSYLDTAGLSETDQYAQVELQKLQLEDERRKKSEENEERHQEIKRQLTQRGLSAAQDSFGAFAELLSGDEERRKENAGKIKAFETAKVAVAGYAEISKIFESYSALPFIGKVIAGFEAVAAGVRTASAISGIKSQSFFFGGDTGRGLFKDSEGKMVAGLVHENEYVVPEWMNRNPTLAPVIQNLEAIRQKGSFAEGGPTSTSSFNIQPTGINATNVTSIGGIDKLMGVVMELKNAVVQFPKESKVSLTSLNKAQGTIDELEKLSGY